MHRQEPRVCIANRWRLALPFAIVSQTPQAPAPRQALALDAWATAARQGSLAAGTMVSSLARGAFVGAGLAQELMPEIAEPEMVESDRVLRYAISSDRPSRRGIVIRQAGRDTSNYHQVVLWGHDWCRYDSAPNPPIGKTIGMGIDSVDGFARTIAAAEFAGKAQNYDLAETVFLLGRDRFIPDCSIAADPLKWFIDEEKDQLVIEEWALLEWSLVPIGDNTDAVKLAAAVQSYGLDFRPYVESVEALLQTLPAQRGIYISQGNAERFLQQMGLAGKVTFSGLLDLGPQLLAIRQTQQPAPEPVVLGKVREDAGELPAEDAAPDAEPTETTPAAEPEPQTEFTTNEEPANTITEAAFRVAVKEGLRQGFLRGSGSVIYLET